MEPSVKQKMMFADTAKKKLCCTSRKTGKTLKIEAYIIHSVMNKTSDALEEYLFDTPGQAHMTPVRERISSKIYQIPIFNMMVKSINKSDGIMDFKNNCKWHMRIEGSGGASNAGRNMIGIRASRRVGDEGAYSQEAAHRERQNTKMPNCDELWCGVPNGIRTSPFYRASEGVDGKLQGWNTHHLCQFDNPIYDNDKARKDLITDHGGENSQSYITQVLGLWGTEAFSAFPPSHIVQETRYPYEEYSAADQAVVAAIEAGSITLDSFFSIPRVNAENFVIGADIGFSPDPTVILLSYLMNECWYMLCKIKLMRVIGTHQAFVIDSLNRQTEYRVKRICIDQIGYGKSVIDALVTDPRFDGRYNPIPFKPEVVINANFGGRIDDGTKDENGKPISKPKKQWSTEMLRIGLANEAMKRRGKIA